MTLWQRIRRALGWTWRNPSECPHPKSSHRWEGAPVYEPDSDLVCGDCGQLLGWFDRRGDWHVGNASAAG